MGIVGNLRTMQLEELLQWLSQSKKTGTLEIKNGGWEKKIFFKDGLILSSSSNKPEEYLGHFLVSRGLITDAQLNAAVEQQRSTRTLLGMLLVNQGALAETELSKMLRLKAEESIYDVFSWDQGDFHFLDNALPESAMVPMRLDVTGIVMEGVQRVDEWRRIRKLIPNEQVVPVALVDLTTIEGLGPGENRILELVDDERSLEEIRLATRTTEFQVCKLLFDQYNLGYLKMVKPRTVSIGGGETKIVEKIVEVEKVVEKIVEVPGPAALGAGGALGAGEISAATLVKMGRDFMAKIDYEAALRHLRAARALDPESQEAQDALLSSERQIRDELDRAGVTLQSIPQVTANMEQLTSSKLSPAEGFLLTRINGNYDIQAILKITPVPQLEAMMTFWKLSLTGYIRLAPPKKPAAAGSRMVSPGR